MSSIFDFIQRLNPHIKKSTVQRDLENSLKELSSFAMPMVKSMADTTAASPLKSEWNNVFESHLRDGIKFSRKSSNIWLDLYAALTNVQSNGEFLKKVIEDYLQEDTLRDGITARASHVVRLVGAISFITNYVAEVTDYSIAQESVVMGDVSDTPPAQEKHIRTSLAKFVSCLKDTALPPKEFEKLFNDIPEAFLTGNTAAIKGMFSAKEIDPFVGMQGVNGWTGSPIFAIRMMWETYHAERFHAMKERKTILELRLIHLQNQQNDSTNPRLQKEIEGLQARINKYDRKIREVESSLE